MQILTVWQDPSPEYPRLSFSPDILICKLALQSGNSEPVTVCFGDSSQTFSHCAWNTDHHLFSTSTIINLPTLYFPLTQTMLTTAWLNCPSQQIMLCNLVSGNLCTFSWILPTQDLVIYIKYRGVCFQATISTFNFDQERRAMKELFVDTENPHKCVFQN